MCTFSNLRTVDCCRPIGLELGSIQFSRYSFVGDTVFQMEVSHPQAVVEMLLHTTFMFLIGAEDGKVRTTGSGKTYWQPRLAAAQLTEAFGHSTWLFPSAAEMVIGGIDLFSAIGQPYCAVLPAAIMEVVKEELGGGVGVSYRRYVKSALLPAVRRVAGLLRNHAATIEVSRTSMRLVCKQHPFADWGGCELQWPSVAWLTEKYPGRAKTESSDS